MKRFKNQEITLALNSLNMQLLDSEHIFIDNSWCCNNVCSPFSRIYCIYSGSAELIHDGRVITMQSGNIYIIPPGVKFGYSCDDAMEKLYFHITITRLDNYDVFSEINDIITIRSSTNKISEMIELYDEKMLYSAILLKTQLYDIVASALYKEREELGAISLYSDVVTRTIKYVRFHLKAGLLTGEIADSLFVSESMLRKQFKKEVGVTLGRYIDDQVMNEAERELGRGKLSVKEISDRFGFCDQFYFSRKFSKAHGISPQKYRKLIAVI